MAECFSKYQQPRERRDAENRVSTKRGMDCSTPPFCELNSSSALNGAEELGGIGT
jgi:hypothetical protein